MQESATMAPDLTLPDGRGNLVRLSDYRREQQLIVFFTRSFL
jgi:peroxiredoxin